MNGLGLSSGLQDLRLRFSGFSADLRFWRSYCRYTATSVPTSGMREKGRVLEGKNTYTGAARGSGQAKPCPEAPFQYPRASQTRVQRLLIQSGTGSSADTALAPSHSNRQLQEQSFLNGRTISFLNSSDNRRQCVKHLWHSLPVLPGRPDGRQPLRALLSALMPALLKIIILGGFRHVVGHFSAAGLPNARKGYPNRKSLIT